VSKNIDHLHLAQLRDYYAQNYCLPSLTTLGEMLNLTSSASAFFIAKRLKKLGFVKSGPDRRLVPGVHFFESTLVDTVPAGTPQPLSGVEPILVDISQRLIRKPSAAVLLKVKGDSMIDAGLISGDYVVVQKDQEANPGDIVVGIVDGDYTVKYLDIDDNGTYLKAANKDFPDIRPKESLKIYGVVTGSFREYPAP